MMVRISVYFSCPPTLPNLLYLISPDRWPDYASHLLFELATDMKSNQRLVRILYNDEIMQIGKYPHTGALYKTEDVPQACEKYEGWYYLEDVFRFLSRLRISNDQYQLEKTQLPKDESLSEKLADQEALLDNRDDLSATLSNSMKTTK